MKGKELVLKAVNEIDKDKFELIDFTPTMECEEIVGKILEDTEILRPVGIEDEFSNQLYEGDIVEFEYYGGKESGTIHYEGCRWLIACDEVEDGYIYLSEFETNDGDWYWLENVERIKNRYEKESKKQFVTAIGIGKENE